MKICIYNVTATTHFGGLETYAWELGRALAARGHNVEIVAGEGGKARHDKVSLVTFPVTPREQFPNLGTRFRKLMERLSFARYAVPHLVSEKFDLVIINKPYDMPALWWARRNGMKAMTLFRSGGTEFFAFDRFFASVVDRWVSTSAYNARQLKERYGRDVRVIANGVDISRFKPGSRDASVRANLGIPDDAIVVVSVGRLVAWKGLHVIVNALNGLPANVHYLVVGQGDQREKLQMLAVDLGVSERVHFAGLVVHAELPRFLVASDIFVQPSIGEEAFGISVVEAMAAGLPVLLSRNGGMVEIVTDGVNGRLLKPGDFFAWRSALLALVGDAKVRFELASSGVAAVEKKFTWEVNAASIERAFSDKE